MIIAVGILQLMLGSFFMGWLLRGIMDRNERNKASAQKNDSPGEAGVPKELCCPNCGLRHIDKDEWAFKPHRTHLCAGCKHEWRPFEYPTVGV